MVLPHHACGRTVNDRLDRDPVEEDLRTMLGKRAEHYTPALRMRQRIVEVTIAGLIEYPEQLSLGDPDRVMFLVLHKVAQRILYDHSQAFTTPNGIIEAAE